MRTEVDLPLSLKIRRCLEALNNNISVQELAEKFDFQQAKLDTWLRSCGILLKYNAPEKRYKEDPTKDVELEFDIFNWAIGEEYEYGFGTKKHGERMRNKAHQLCLYGKYKVKKCGVQTRIVGNKLTVKRVR